MSKARKLRRKLAVETAQTPADQKQKVAAPLHEIQVTNDPFRFALIMTGIFLVIAIFGMFQHEMWRDEYQAWLVARDAHSIGQVFQNMKFEGNPALWQIFLYFITCFTHDPVYMQIFHLLIACGFIYVFNRYAPLRKPFRVLFTLGYFPLYEYTIISRSYGMGLLLLFIICALYKDRTKWYIWIGILLGLMANVTVYSLIIASGIAGILILDLLMFQDKNKKNILQLSGGMAIFAVFAVLSLYQIWPDKDNSFPVIYAKEAMEGPRWGFVASRFFSTYLYIPDISGINFWNSNAYVSDYVTINPPIWQWMKDHPAYLWSWVYLPILLFLTSLTIFMRKPLILLLYTGVTIVLLSLFYYTILVYYRYCGHLFTLLIICYWLSEYYPDKKYDHIVLRKLAGLGKRISKPFLLVLLLFQVIGAAFAYLQDYKYEFSPGKSAAAYIKEHKLDTLTIVGAPDYVMSPLASELNTKIYYPEMEAYGSFAIWSTKRRDSMNFQQLIQSISSLIGKDRDKFVWIESEQRNISPDGKNFVPMERALIGKDVKLELLQKFVDGVVLDENYYIYLVQKTDSVKTDYSKYPRLY
jgi:hypothetical protein